MFLKDAVHATCSKPTKTFHFQYCDNFAYRPTTVHMYISINHKSPDDVRFLGVHTNTFHSTKLSPKGPQT